MPGGSPDVVDAGAVERISNKYEAGSHSERSFFTKEKPQVSSETEVIAGHF